VPFNPTVLDGRSTVGLEVPKSNWAMPLEVPPFEAYSVTCGITFTFGGVRTDPEARVTDVEGRAIPNLYTCGEMLGGLFYLNYPGGSGLTSGSVFGRVAGTHAAIGV
jgi:tricarballylate dehydrogenase